MIEFFHGLSGTMDRAVFALFVIRPSIQSRSIEKCLPPLRQPCLNRRGRARRPSVALLVESSNAYARGLLAGVTDFMRRHEAWSITLPEQGRGDAPPAWWRAGEVMASSPALRPRHRPPAP